MRFLKCYMLNTYRHGNARDSLLYVRRIRDTEQEDVSKAVEIHEIVLHVLLIKNGINRMNTTQRNVIECGEDS